MDDQRFEELMGRLLDEDLSADELSELVALAKGDAARVQELCSQLEMAELIAQSEDALRRSELFVAAVQSRVGDDSFVESVRTAIHTKQQNQKLDKSFYRIGPWVWAATIAASVLLMVSLFFKSPAEPNHIAKITGLSGAVLWTGNGGLVDSDLAVGKPLPGGTLEGMTPDSWVELQFNDGSKVTISGDSMLTFSDHGQKLLRLKEGSIAADVRPQPKGKPMLIHTRSARFEVIGTRFVVDTAQASTTLNVSEGSVRAQRLSDGKTVDVPAKHRVVAAVDQELVAVKVPDSVSLWKSQLDLGPEKTHGTWLAPTQDEPARLRQVPFHIRRPHRKTWTIYPLGFGVSKGDTPPVELDPGTRIRVKGRMKTAHRLWIGVTLSHANGDFAGRFQIVLPKEQFSDGEKFAVVVNLSEFHLDPSLQKWADKLPARPDGLVVKDLWCHSLDDYVALEVTHGEFIAAMTPMGGPKVSQKKEEKSIEEKTKVHRLATKKRSPFDAFVYVNRIPYKSEEGESPEDLSGRILGRLANQEGRILLKLPPGMDRAAYLGFKTFINYEGKMAVGQCAACHTPASFRDGKEHVVVKGGTPTATPTLRNHQKSDEALRKILFQKIVTSKAKRSGKAQDVDDVYGDMKINEKDIPNLIAFLKQLGDTSDDDFRKLILNAKLLDTSKDIESDAEGRP